MRTGRSLVTVLAAMLSLIAVLISGCGGGDRPNSSNNEDEEVDKKTGENGKQKVGITVDGKAGTPEDIKEGQQVQLEYTTKDDKNLVRSVQLFSVSGEEATG